MLPIHFEHETLIGNVYGNLAVMIAGGGVVICLLVLAFMFVTDTKRVLRGADSDWVAIGFCVVLAGVFWPATVVGAIIAGLLLGARGARRRSVSCHGGVSREHRLDEARMRIKTLERELGLLEMPDLSGGLRDEPGTTAYGRDRRGGR